MSEPTSETNWSWEDPDPADVRPLTTPEEWLELLEDYEANDPDALRAVLDRVGPTASALQRCLQVAWQNGATCAVVETRYRDADFESEYLSYYARMFADLPRFTHRIHFFRKPLTDQDLGGLPEDRDGVVAASVGYVGFVIVRPLAFGLVGRTMLLPPPALRRHVRASVREPVTFFGQLLHVDAVPFQQQDSLLARCAHAAVWMCAFVAYRRGDGPRRTTGEITRHADPALGPGRPLPSPGLSFMQISALLHELGLGAAYYDVEQFIQDVRGLTRADGDEPLTSQTPDGAPDRALLTRFGSRVLAARTSGVVCRYLNSGLPVLVVTTEHAIVLCGYRRTGSSQNDTRPSVDLVYHDDSEGPYLTLAAKEQPRRLAGSPEGDRGLDWQAIFAPQPEEVWLSPDVAEYLGARLLLMTAERLREAGVAEIDDFQDNVENLTFRTYLATTNLYKRGLPARGLHPTVVRSYRLARLPKHVWVVEAVRRDLRNTGDRACVVGEVLLDPSRAVSESAEAPARSIDRLGVLAIHLPGRVFIQQTDGATVELPCDGKPFRTGGSGPA